LASSTIIVVAAVDVVADIVARGSLAILLGSLCGIAALLGGCCNGILGCLWLYSCGNRKYIAEPLQMSELIPGFFTKKKKEKRTLLHHCYKYPAEGHQTGHCNWYSYCWRISRE
jgi:hypothetical protein